MERGSLEANRLPKSSRDRSSCQRLWVERDCGLLRGKRQRISAVTRISELPSDRRASHGAREYMSREKPQQLIPVMRCLMFRVRRTGTVQQSRNQACREERQSYAQGETNGDHFHSLSDNQTQNISMRCAQGHANTDFVSTPGNRIGNHSVQAERRQREGHSRKRAKQKHVESLVHDGASKHAFHRAEVECGHVAACGRYFPLDLSRNTRGRWLCPNHEARSDNLVHELCEFVIELRCGNEECGRRRIIQAILADVSDHTEMVVAARPESPIDHNALIG